MTEEERLNAGKAQINGYLNSQFPKWRLFAVLTTKKLITEFNVFEEINDTLTKTPDYFPQRQYYTGLILQALSESLQSIEDLFALILFSKDVPMFFKNIANYSAGKVTNFIKTGKLDVSNVAEHFWIPFSIDPDRYDDKVVPDGLMKLINHLLDALKVLQRFYIEFEYLYTQYKHGQSIVYQWTAAERQVIKKKELDDGIVIVPFDNLEITRALEKGRAKLGASIFFSDWTQKHIAELNRQNNLLRFILGIETITIDRIVEITTISVNLLECLRYNLLKFCELPKIKIFDCCFPGNEFHDFVIMSGSSDT
jgi:hypothetical protein